MLVKLTCNVLIIALFLGIASTDACPYARTNDGDDPHVSRYLQGRGGRNGGVRGGGREGRGREGGGDPNGGREGRNDGRGRDGRDGRGRGRGGGRGGGGGGGEGGIGDANIPIAPVQGLTTQQAIDAASTNIREILNDRRRAFFVRLAFHDCIGSCDGCVDTSNPSNFGLDDPIEDLAPIVEAYSPNLSRADIWVLAGMVAAEVAQENNNPVQFEMEFVGRSVCPDPTGGPDRGMSKDMETRVFAAIQF